ncbi:MAG: hypothetical protein O2856_06015, partial [Planctomycetota bacterium]|nr:hypothetical protein [Planctomycetota bacterium]
MYRNTGNEIMAEATPTLKNHGSADRITFGHLKCVMCLLIFTNATTSKAEEESLRWIAPVDSSSIHINRVEQESASIVHRFRIQNNGDLSPLVFKSPCKASKLHNDFEASIQVIASIAGLRPGLIILLPQQIDPRTGRPLQTIIRGDLLREIDV